MKKWKMGVFFCKKVDLSSTQGTLCTVSVFFILHFTFLGGAYASNAPHRLRACKLIDVDVDSDLFKMLFVQSTVGVLTTNSAAGCC